MDAMKKAIMKRRMKLAGDGMEDMSEEFAERKDADMNPDEGSEDDLTIARMDKDDADNGLAPETEQEESMEAEAQEPEMQGQKSPDHASVIEAIMSKDDLGKGGIRGKAAAKMMAALQALKGQK